VIVTIVVGVAVSLIVAIVTLSQKLYHFISRRGMLDCRFCIFCVCVHVHTCIHSLSEVRKSPLFHLPLDYEPIPCHDYDDVNPGMLVCIAVYM